MNKFNGKSPLGDGTESISESNASVPVGIMAKGGGKRKAAGKGVKISSPPVRNF